MTAPFPHHYRAQLVWTGSGAAVLRAGHRPTLPGGAPPEFDGDEVWWSPEHLLLEAANLCLMTTFQSVARRGKLGVSGYEGEAEGILDRGPEGLAFRSIHLRVILTVAPEDAEKARGLLDTAHRHCIVANALRPPVTVEALVKAADVRPEPLSIA